MLAEERMDGICRLVEDQGSVTVPMLTEAFGASESTIRRDLTELAKRGLLIKVHGGAMALGSGGIMADSDVLLRQDMNREEKEQAARYAASLLEPHDFIYLDAGTTTGYLIDYITEKQITVVTNGIMHARRLAGKGIEVCLPGGQLKPMTEAIVGEEAVERIGKYHFTKGFFGANGVDLQTGFTTPDVREAKLKEAAMAQCREPYVVCDSAKISRTSSVTFGAFLQAAIIVSGTVEHRYETCRNVFIV